MDVTDMSDVKIDNMYLQNILNQEWILSGGLESYITKNWIERVIS